MWVVELLLDRLQYHKFGSASEQVVNVIASIELCAEVEIWTNLFVI